MLHLDAILYPTDYSEQSAFAFRVACSLARDHDAHVIVLHVVMTLGPEQITFGEAGSQLEPEGYRQKLLAELRQIQSHDPAVRVEHVLVEGDAAHEIVRAAQDRSAALIVMGTHGRTGLKRLLMGSVAEQVMRTAPCPVLTVKGPSSFMQ